MGRTVRRSDPTTAEKISTLDTLQRFEALWRKIEASSSEHFALTLRQAANVVGFALFPVGWLWSEYPRAKGEKLTDIEREAQQLGLLGIPDGDDIKERQGRAVRAIRAGADFRRDAVERLLRRFIHRADIRVIATDSTGLRTIIPENARFDPTFCLDVRANRMEIERNGRRMAWQFETDALDLTLALKGHCAWGDRKTSPNDWFRLERFLREQFERNGLPSTRSVFVEEAAEWWARETASSKEPPMAPLRAKASELYDEYSFSKNVASKK
jgi:hypothetical protein